MEIISKPYNYSKDLINLKKPVMISMESFQSLKDYNVVSDDGNVIDAGLIECDVLSRNPSYYPLTDTLDSLNKGGRVQEKILNQVFDGEAEHPRGEFNKTLQVYDPVPIDRMMYIDPDRVSHTVLNYRNIKGTSLIRGNIMWCGPFGPDYKHRAETGSNMGFSIRAYTPVYIEKETSSGRKYFIKKFLMYIAAFDCVKVPGLATSRIVHPDQWKNTNMNNNIIRSNEDFSLSETIIRNPLDDIRELMVTRSNEAADLLGEVYGLSLESANMAIKGNDLILRDTKNGINDDIHIPLSAQILKRVMG